MVISNYLIYRRKTLSHFWSDEFHAPDLHCSGDSIWRLSEFLWISISFNTISMRRREFVASSCLIFQESRGSTCVTLSCHFKRLTECIRLHSLELHLHRLLWIADSTRNVCLNLNFDRSCRCCCYSILDIILWLLSLGLQCLASDHRYFWLRTTK